MAGPHLFLLPHLSTHGACQGLFHLRAFALAILWVASLFPDGRRIHSLTPSRSCLNTPVSENLKQHLPLFSPFAWFPCSFQHCDSFTFFKSTLVVFWSVSCMKVRSIGYRMMTRGLWEWHPTQTLGGQPRFPQGVRGCWGTPKAVFPRAPVLTSVVKDVPSQCHQTCPPCLYLLALSPCNLL